MRLNLYDTELNRIAIIDERFVSCFWSEGYNTVEDFSLELQATDEYRKKVRPDFYVGRTDRKTLMVIKTVEILDDRIIATGKQAARVLDDVPFVGTISSGSSIPKAVSAAYLASMQFPHVVVSSDGPDIKFSNQISHKSFMELCRIMCQSEDVGFRTVKRGSDLVVEFYMPEANPNLVFSERYGNLDFKGFVRSTANKKNYAVVLGAGEGTSRRRVNVDISGGEQIRAIIVDAKDLQPEDGETDEDYNARLYARGVEKLLQHAGAFDCLFSASAADFGKKYDLGDIITVLLPKYGVKLNARVSRFTQISQENMTDTTVEVGQITILR